MDKLWRNFNSDIINEIPIHDIPEEGVDVMTTDGESISTMWYVMSGEYKWCIDDIHLPFEPTHWMPLDDYKIFLRTEKINELV